MVDITGRVMTMKLLGSKYLLVVISSVTLSYGPSGFFLLQRSKLICSVNYHGIQ